MKILDLLLLIVSLCLASPVLALSSAPEQSGQAPGVSVTVEGPVTADERITWSYAFAFSDLDDGQSIAVRLALPEDADASEVSCEGCASSEPKDADRSVGIYREWGFDAAGDAATVSLEVRIRDDRGKIGAVAFGADVAGVALAGAPPRIGGPEPLYDPSFFRPILGVGITHRFDDFADFETLDVDGDDVADILNTINDSKRRATAMIGGAFRLGEIRGRTLDALLSFNFTEGSTNTLDAFFFGIGYAWTEYLEFAFGYSLTRAEELGAGFRREAALLVRAQQAAGNPAFARFRVNDDGTDLDGDKLYDGFPLQTPDGDPLFTGDVIKESFNSSITFGIVIPLDIGRLLSGSAR